jgi:uncharacterized repeat protein (TIGR01451 family)
MRRFSLAFLLSLVVGCLWAGGAQAAVLYDQMTPLQEPQSGFDSNQFTVLEPVFGSDQQVADDFTVPAGQSWTISQVDVAGFYTGSQAIPTNVNVFLYATDPNNPDIPVDPPLFQQLNTATSNGPNYVIPLTSAPALGPGHYWVSVQQLGAFWNPQAQENNQWIWRVLDIQADGIGSQPAMKRFPPSDSCLTWTSLTGCTDTGTRNMAFRLHAADPLADLAIDKSTKVDFTRPGAVVAYRIRVSNPGTAAAVNVTVCDRLPPDQTALRAKGAFLKKKRKVCWRLNRLGPGEDRVFNITTQISLRSPARRQRNVAVARAENVARRPQDDAVVRLRAVPDTCVRSLSARPVESQPYC